MGQLWTDGAADIRRQHLSDAITEPNRSSRVAPWQEAGWEPSAHSSVLGQIIDHVKNTVRDATSLNAAGGEYIEFAAEALATVALFRFGQARLEWATLNHFTPTAQVKIGTDMMTELPVYEGIGQFRRSGTLSPGLYKATWDEFSERFGTNEHRRHLLSGLQAVANNLAEAGSRELRVGASFVTAKAKPGDFDAVWIHNSQMDTGKLFASLEADNITKAKYEFGGDVQSSRVQRLILSFIPPKISSGATFLASTRSGRPAAMVSLDPARVPPVVDFKPCSFGLPLGCPLSY